jgi:hypothetical protein
MSWLDTVVGTLREMPRVAKEELEQITAGGAPYRQGVVDLLRGKIPKLSLPSGPLPTVTGAGTATQEQVMNDPGVQAALAFTPMGLGILKGKGGNWFPGEVEKVAKELERNLPSFEPHSQVIKDWLRGPMTNYVKNRLGTQEDEIRQLRDEGVGVIEPQERNFHMVREAHQRRGEMGTQPVAETNAGAGWENSVDALLVPDREIAANMNRGAKSRQISYFRDLTPEQRLGNLTARFLRKTQDLGLKAPGGELPPEIQDLMRVKARDLIPEDMDAITQAVKANPGLLVPSLRGSAVYMPGAVKQYATALPQMYKHLDAPPGTPYPGPMIPVSNSMRTEPFDVYGSKLPLNEVRKSLAGGADWPAKIPEDQPIWSLKSGYLPGMQHVVDTLRNSLAEGRIRPEQLKSGAMSVRGAVLHTHEMDQQVAAAAKAAEKLPMSANLELPAVKEYPSGWKWVDLPDPATSSVADKTRVLKIGEQGGWCTRSEEAARTYGSGKYRLKALLDPEGRPHAQIQEDARGNLHQVKPTNNSWQGERAQSAMRNNPNYQREVQGYMQDYIRSNPRRPMVNDLHHAGMRKVQGVPGYFTQEEILQIARDPNHPHFAAMNQYLEE